MADENDLPADQPPNEPSDLGSLEAADSGEENSLDGGYDSGSLEANPGDGQPAPTAPKPAAKLGWFGRLRQRFNIYLLLFILVIVLAVTIIVIAYLQNRQAPANQIKTQKLSQSTLEQLANSDATVGSSQSVLNVQSSAVFAGQVLIRQGLEVAGNLQIGGTVALNNIAVSGTSQLGQAIVSRDLAVTGNTALQGTTTISKSLQVGGNGSFSGPLSAPQITTSSLQLNGDLVLTHHISTGGGQPGRSNGPALGGGGSVSVSGSDTAGSVTINTGGSPAAGCFVTITFASRYNTTPHVLVTPVGSAAGGLGYYINRSATSFSICDATAAPGGSSFGFDYFVVD